MLPPDKPWSYREPLSVPADVPRRRRTKRSSETTDAVIVTTRAPRAADLVRGVCEPLGSALAGIPYAGSAVVCLGYPRDAVAHPLDAAGLVIPRQEQRTVLAISFSSSKFPGRAPAGHVLMRVFLGGALDPEAATLPDETLTSTIDGSKMVPSTSALRGAI